MEMNKLGRLVIAALVVTFKTFVLLSDTIFATRIANPAPNKYPEIWLSAFQAPDSFHRTDAESDLRSKNLFQNDFLSKNGSDFVIFEGTINIEYTCEAEYPITWNFPFPEQIQPALDNIISPSTRVSTLTEEDLEPRNVRFRNILSISCGFLQFLSANLTCGSTEMHPEINSSIYIYLHGKSVIEHKGKTLTVSVNSNQKSSDVPPVLLPCRPASPDIQLLLEKEEVTKTPGSSDLPKSWTRISEEYLTFDPKIGFTLDRRLLGDKVFGFYRCTVMETHDDGREEIDREEFVYVNVTKTTVNQVDCNNLNFESKSIVHGNASIHLGYSAEEKCLDFFITCCTGVADKPPKLYIELCSSSMQCELLKKTILERSVANTSVEYYEHNRVNGSSDCYKDAAFGLGTLVVCQAENIDFAEYFIEKFHPLTAGPMTNRSRRIIHANLSNERVIDAEKDRILVSLSRYESITKPVTTNQTIMMTVGRELMDDMDDSILENYGPPIYFPIVKDFVKTIYMVEYDRDFYYEGEPMTFMCFGLKFFYADGAHLRLNWKNSTKTHLSMPLLKNKVNYGKSKLTQHYMYFSGKADALNGMGKDVVSVFGTSLLASQEMISVDCWMPHEHTSKWDKISRRIKVVPSVPPKFVEKEEEMVNFYVGDKGNVLTCNINEGQPLPGLKVTKDGKDLEINSNNGTENQSKNDSIYTVQTVKDKLPISIRIHFGVINLDHQCVLRCIAMNANETVKRTIKIFVIERRGIALPIILSIVCMLCFIIIGLGAKHWREKRSVWYLRGNK